MTTASPLPAEASLLARLGGLLRRHLQLIVGVPISIWSIWLLVRDVDVAEVADQLGHSNWLLLLICLASVPVAMSLKCLRWRYLFVERTAPPFPPLISSLYIGYLMNTVLPARVGEFVRAYLVGRQPAVGTPAALATIALEKILDLATLGFLLIVLILARQLPDLPDWMSASAYTSAVALVAGLLGLVVTFALRQRIVGLVALLEERITVLRRLRLKALATSFLDTLAVLADRRTLTLVIFWSFVVWSCSALTLWAGVAGVGISIGPSAIMLALVVTNLGMAAPSAPGYVGVFHLLLVESLQPFGVDRSHALGAAVIVHTIIFGNFIVGGLWFLWRGGYSLGSLRQASGH
jgi:glycosyltransferase 2 family protein